MKRLFTIFVLLAVTYSYGQCLSENNIVFENDRLVNLNNGAQFEKIAEKDANSLTSTSSVNKYKEIGDIKLILNRVIILKNANGYKEMIEYVNGIFSFYEYKDFENLKSKKEISLVVQTYDER